MARVDNNGHRSADRGEEGQSAQTSEDPTATGGTLMRVTVNLTPRSTQALERASRATGDTKTDTINRALQVYAIFLDLAERGGGSIKVVHGDNETERVYLL